MILNLGKTKKYDVEILKTGVFTGILLLSIINIMAQTKQKFLSAEESDPIKIGWMQGFPPPADKTLRPADGSFFNFPAKRWSVVHMWEMMPAVKVSRGLGAPENLKYDLDQSFFL